MPDRLLMDSESLRKRHPKEYVNFFVANDLVVSACCVLPMGTAVGHRSRYLRTMMKLPIRFYVGFKKTRAPGEARFGNVSTFCLPKERFERYPYEKAVAEHAAVAGKISEFLKEKKAGFGVEISILGETARGHGIGFSGTTSAAISAGLHLLCGAATREDLEGAAATDHEGAVFRLALELDFISRYGNTFGDNISLSLSNAGLSLHWSQEFGQKTGLEGLRKIRIGSKILEKDGEPVRASALPLDFCVIFSGLPTKTKNVESGAVADRAWIEECAQIVRSEIFPKGAPKGVAAGALLEKNGAFEKVTDGLAAVNLQTAAHFLRLAADPFGRQAVADLLENADHHRMLLTAAERHSPFAAELLRAIHARPEGDRPVGLIPSYSGKLGGAYAVISEAGSLRTAVLAAVDALRAKYPDIAVEYASWTDGDATDGPRVEHWTEGGVRPKEMPRDAVTFRDNRGAHYVGGHAEIAANETDCLLLDLIEMKVSLMGKRASSKDLPSQSAAAELLSGILAGGNGEIRNSALSSSSYSKDKAMMVGKVIAPLSAFVERVTGDPLPMECRGSGGDFIVSLGKTDLRIGVVSR